MYDGLTPLFDNVTDGDLTPTSSPRRWATSAPTAPARSRPWFRPARRHRHPRRLQRPAHRGRDDDEDGIWAAGWLIAEDRGLLLQQARYNARVAAIDVPGLCAIGLTAALQNFQPSPETEAIVAEQAEGSWRRPAPKARRSSMTSTPSSRASTPTLDPLRPATADWTRNDIFALNSLKSQFLGPGRRRRGAARAVLRRASRMSSATTQGMCVFNDLRQFKNPESPTTIDGKFPYGKIPEQGEGQASSSTLARLSRTPRRPRRLAERYSYPTQQASNTLMITGDESATGDPLMVGGPQIGYFYPGFTYEMDMDARRPPVARRHLGAVPRLSADRPRRGLRDHAHLRLGGRDRPVRGDALRRQRHEVHVQRRVHDMELFEAGTLGGIPVEFYTTVHGPVIGLRGRSTASGSRSRAKRAGYGEDVDRPPLQPAHLERHGGELQDFFDAARRRRRRSTPSTSTPTTSPSTRPASCRSATRTSIRACRPTAPASTSGRAILEQKTTRRASIPRTGR